MEQVYINIQTKEVLDMEMVESLKDNALLKIVPEMFIEWNFEKNKELDLRDITFKSGRKVWWIGKECKHEWQSTVAHRTNGRNCPYCNKNNPKTLKGFNDLWTTDKDIAIMMNNPEQGYLYSRKSDVKVEWKCPNCKNILIRAIKDATRRGINCSICTDGMSFGEKIVYNLLMENNIPFEYDRATSFSENKRYDFYIESLSTIIEVHGEQHKKQATGTFGRNRSLEEEVQNDILKRQLAINIGIVNYIELSITDNNIKLISKEIENSILLNILGIKDINWTDIYSKSQKSLIIEVCKVHSEDGNITTGDLVKMFNISKDSVIRYLKIGDSLDICEYVPRARDRWIKNKNRYNNRKVIQMSLNGEYIKEYDSINDATKITGCNNISKHCKNSTSTKGYNWMYKEDYDKMIKSK